MNTSLKIAFKCFTPITLAACLLLSACGGDSAVVSDPVQESTAAPAATEILATPEPTPTPEEPSGLRRASDADIINLGELEASAGPGSLVAAAQKQFFSIEDLGPGWAAIGGGISTVAECESATLVAQNQGRLGLFDEASQEVGFANQVELLIEIHEDAEAAQARVDGTIGENRVRCQSAALAQVPADPSGLYRMESPDAGGIEVEPLIDAAGVRSAAFEATFFGPGLAIPLERTVTAWSDGNTVMLLSVITHDGTNEAVTGDFYELIAANGAPALIEERDELVDAAVELVRAATAQDDTVAQFFNRTGALEVGPEADASDCNQAYEDPSLVEFSGPVWGLPTGVSGLAQSATVFGSPEAAKREIERMIRSGAECIGEVGPNMIIGVNETQSTFVEADVVEGVPSVLFSADILQKVEGPAGMIEGDARMIWVLAQVDSVVLAWGFVGLAGDEPDMAALLADSVSRAQAPR